MGDKYIVDEEAVKVWITDIYGISVQSLTKLDLGADIHSTLYRVESTDSKSYFLKFRTGNFEEISVSIPYFLTKSGIPHLVAPIETTARTLFAQYQTSWGMIYPWVDAKTSAEQPMSASEWQQFGSTLQAIHTAVLPENITAHLKVETFSTHWLDQFTLVLTHELQKTHADDLSSVVRGFLSEKKSVLDDLHIKTRELHSRISGKNFQKVLCHADLHAANVLVDTAENIHIVDWDNPILAPIERDLMFVGAGIIDVWNTDQELQWFYKGYGKPEINVELIQYYRYLRVIEDIVVTARSIFEGEGTRIAREKYFGYIRDNFYPNGTIALAEKTQEQLQAIF